MRTSQITYRKTDESGTEANRIATRVDANVYDSLP